MTTQAGLDLHAHLVDLLDLALRVVAPDHPQAIVVERSRQAQHGDYACNVALQLAKSLKRNPREIAAALVAALPTSPCVAKAEVAGAGFINIFLRPETRQASVPRILELGPGYGHSTAGQAKKVQVEFVSANPTGPLHVGHGRGAAYGASLCNVLAATGYQVSREYYVNDSGRQMDILALSTWLRYLELCGIAAAFPGNAYQGDYVRAMARAMFTEHGTRFKLDVSAETIAKWLRGKNDESQLDALIASAKDLLGKGYQTILEFALARQLDDCREDLREFGVTFDTWFSEKTLFDSGRVERAIKKLEEKDCIFTENGARWFRSTRFGDEKERVVQRENGQYTYFASDIAYHVDKIERGFDLMIDIWGADHHGYIPRLKGALAALGAGPDRLTVALVQFAVLYRGGKKASMSTRAGEFVTLRELRQEVGNDAARFFYVLRKSDQHLDFDLDLAKSKSNDNPVYYVQYAHARVCSVLDQWEGDSARLASADPSPLVSAQEIALLSRLMDYPVTVENAARELAPHLIAFYLRELAAEFHSYYNSTRLLVPEDGLKLARLALAVAVRQVLCNGLLLLGVSAPEKM